MNILFCNMAWTNEHSGSSDADQPGGSGSDLNKPGAGSGAANFLDYNGKCYGYFAASRKLALERHFAAVRKEQPYVEDVLVVWVAANEAHQTRIVGWYKHARVYREMQLQEAFIDAAHSLQYNATASASDCFLLPADQRTFPIPRADSAGKGKGFGSVHYWYADTAFGQTEVIPKVVKYIDTYDGNFANQVYSDEMLQAMARLETDEPEYEVLFNEGAKRLDHREYLDALQWFNAARQVQETPLVLFNIANCLENLNRFDRAIAIYEGLLESAGDRQEILFGLMRSCDFVGDRAKTLEYCQRVLPLLDEGIAGEELLDGQELKVGIIIVIAQLYHALQDFGSSQAAIKEILSVSASEENQKIVADWNAFLDREAAKP